MNTRRQLWVVGLSIAVAVTCILIMRLEAWGFDDITQQPMTRNPRMMLRALPQETRLVGKVRLTPLSVESLEIGAPGAVTPDQLRQLIDLNTLAEVPLGKRSLFRLDFERSFLVAGIKVYGAADAVLSVQALDQGVWQPISGLSAVPLSRLGPGWNEIEASVPYRSQALRFEWDAYPDGSRTSIPEMEVWGTDKRVVVPDAMSLRPYLVGPELPWTLHAFAAKPVELGIGVTASGAVEDKPALITVSVDRDPHEFNRAFLVYELSGWDEWTSVSRSINGLTALQGALSAPQGGWNLQVEEIDPSWLQLGENSVEFSLSSQAFVPFKVRGVRIIAEADDGSNFVNVITDSESKKARRRHAIYDGSIDTGWSVAPTGVDSAVEFGFSKNVQLSGLEIYMATRCEGTLEVEALGLEGWWTIDRVDIGTTLAPGWSLIPVRTSLATKGLRVRQVGASAPDSMRELIPIGSAVGDGTQEDTLHVTHPERGRFTGREGYIRGFIRPKGDITEKPEIWVDSQQVDYLDGAFEAIVTKDDVGLWEQADAEPWSVTVRLLYADGSDLTRAIVLDDGVVDLESSENQLLPRRSFPLGRGKAYKLSHDGSSLDLEPDAILEPLEIGITPLADSDLEELGTGMTNVTRGPRRGYRFEPHGMKFQKKIRVSLPFNAGLIPPGFTDAEVFSYYFDEETGRWIALERLEVDRERNRIVSLTDHFTDMINATVTVPDHPTPVSFNPTSMKDIKAADPGERVRLIDTPQPQSTGDLRLTYPIDLPPGRLGMEPKLSLEYDSTRANGWLGIGWDLPIPSITIETRWGVPRYDAAKETETYLLNGAQLTPVAHRSVPVSRVTGTATFHTRIEGQFQRIIRDGNDPKDYRWEITDKNGTRWFYGRPPELTATENRTLTDADDNIFVWPLVETRDLNGNAVKYSYAEVSDVGVANGSVFGSELYLDRIEYTASQGQAGPYTVSFVRDTQLGEARRADVGINARGGFKRVTASLLRKIEVKYLTEMVRSYEMVYEEGVFSKSRLRQVRQYGSAGTLFNTHEFEYFNEVLVGPRNSTTSYYDGFAPSTIWSAGDNHIEASLLGEGSATAISSTDGSTLGAHVFVGFGAAGMKEFTGGGKVGYSRSESTGRVSLMDINGDRLPDKVYKDGLVYFNPNTSRTTGYGSFGPAHEVENLQVLSRENTSTDTAGPEAFFSFTNLLYDFSSSFTQQSAYLSDVNGDGLPDLVDNQSVMFSHIGSNGVPTFTGSSNATPVPIGGGTVDSAGIIQNYDSLRESRIDAYPLIDTVRKWRAPYDGSVRISGDVALIQSMTAERLKYLTADGVRVVIQVNDKEMWSNRILADDYAPKSPVGVDEVVIRKGDRIYFRVQSISDGAYDQVDWDPAISYLNVATLDDGNQLNPYLYQASTDFALVGRATVQRICRPFLGCKSVTFKSSTEMPFDGTVRLAGSVLKKSRTSDDVTVRVVHIDRNNDVETLVHEATLAWNQVGPVEVATDIDVAFQEKIRLELAVDSPIDLAQLEWTPELYFIAANHHPYAGSTPADYAQLPAPRITDDAGNYIVQLRPTYVVDVFPEDGLSAPEPGFEAPRGGRIRVFPQLQSLFTAPDGDVVFTIKHDAGLLHKQRITVNGDDVTKRYAEIDVEKGWRLHFGYATKDPWLRDYLYGLGVSLFYVGQSCGECADSDAAVHPGASEGSGTAGTCADGEDNDCDSLIDGDDPGCTLPVCDDADQDGYTPCSASCDPGKLACGDCDDTYLGASPATVEGNSSPGTCSDTRDDDCDSLVDVADPGCVLPTCADADRDGFAVCTSSCEPGLKRCGDCDDTDVAVNDGIAEGTGAPGTCGNGLDDDCDGDVDVLDRGCFLPACPDADADGYAICSASCDMKAGAGGGTYNLSAPLYTPIRHSATNPSDSDLFAQTYRGWDFAGYNGNRGRADQPLDESELFLKNTNSAPREEPFKNEAFTFYSRPFDGVYAGPDDSSWVTGYGASSSRAGLDQIEVPRESDFAGAGGGSSRGVPRLSRSTHGTLQASVALLSGSNTEGGAAYSEVDFLDFNGDQFPDIVGNGRIQFTTPLGALDGTNTEVEYLGLVRESNPHSANFGIGGDPASFIVNGLGKLAAPGAPRNQKSGSSMPSLGLSGSLGTGESPARTDLLDINGDGLPDRIIHDGGSLRVRFNLGRKFSDQEEPWGTGRIANGSSESSSLGATPGFNSGSYSFAGGLSLSRSTSNANATLVDLNGDGMLDRVSPSGAGTTVGFNTGNGFTSADLEWTGALSSQVSTSMNTELSGGAYFSVSFPVCFPPVCWIVINPGGTAGAFMSRQTVALMDVNGDGYPDHLRSFDDRILEVAENRVGRTNLLQTVRRPLGGELRFDYTRTGNTYAQPDSRWVLSRVEVFDGQPGDGDSVISGRGITSLTTYSYSDGQFDRLEREFYGFGIVTEEERDPADDSLYRRSIRTYSNDDFYSKGLVLTERIEDGAGKPFIETHNTFNLRDVSTGSVVQSAASTTATLFPHLINMEKPFFEGNASPSKSTSMSYEYDTNGNIIRMVDLADAGSEDDVDVEIAYSNCLNEHLVGVPLSIEVTGDNRIMRRRQATIECATGDITQVRQYLADGSSAVTDMTYFPDGNLREITGPLNHRNQRYLLGYIYDTATNTHITSIRDSHGLSSMATHDLRFGTPASTTDINGNVTEYLYDEFGRTASITGPYEQGTGLATLQFAYHPEASPPWALTSHADPFRSATDTIDTVLFVDGLKRVLQTKKDATVHVGAGSVPQDVMTVSGRVLFDSFGRTTAVRYPTIEPLGSPGTINATPDSVPPTTTTMRYDVLDRTTEVVIPDGTKTSTNFGFGTDREGTTQFETTLTDANGISKRSYRDVRELIVAIRETNKGGLETIWTSYAYDPLKQIIKVKDDHGNVTNVAYDNLGRRTVIDNPDAGRVETVFDLASNEVGRITPNLRARGTRIGLDYDFLRLIAIRYPEFPGNNVSYEYGADRALENRAGRITVVRDESGVEERGYGRLGELVRETKTIASDTLGGSPNSPEVYTTQWAYDTFGRLQNMVYPDGEVLTYQYDSGGMPRQVSGVKGANAYAYVHRIEYDKFEQRRFLELGNGVRTSYSYRSDNRRLEELVSMMPSSRVFQNLGYSYDPVGNIKRLRNNVAVPAASDYGGPTDMNFGYDDLYRLVAASGRYEFMPNKTRQFSLAMDYNTIHNIVSKHQVDAVIQPSGTSTQQHKTSYSWAYAFGTSRPHAPSHIGDRTFQYDGNGNQGGWTNDRNGTRRTIVWDEENRIQSIADNGHTETYKYDDQGERVIKRGPQGETAYVNPFFTMRNREVGTKHVLVGTTRLVSKLLKQDKPGGSPSGTQPYEKDLYYYHPDHIGSSNYVTDADGDLFEHLEYFPFGESWVQESSNTQRTPYLFTSKELDEETGLQYFGARYYDPRTSVWQSADPIVRKYLPIGRTNTDHTSTIGGVYNSLNLALYTYAHLNPLITTDPDGNWASQKGAYVHQRVTYLVIGQHLQKGQNEILARAQVYADKDEFQSAQYSYRHAMRSSKQTTSEARALANLFVRGQFEKAWALKKAGKEREALFEFGIGLHTLQDSTSPAHRGFQLWSGEETFGEKVEHVMQEVFDPGSGSGLHNITKDAWGWYQSGKLPGGDLFKAYDGETITNSPMRDGRRNECLQLSEPIP